MHVLLIEPAPAPDGASLIGLSELLEVLGHTVEHRHGLPHTDPPPLESVTVIDARVDPGAAGRWCSGLARALVRAPVLAVVDEQTVGAVSAAWGLGDFFVAGCSAAQLAARLARAAERHRHAQPPRHRYGPLTLDDSSLTAAFDNGAVQLTHGEYKLLKNLASHSNRVVPRSELTRGAERRRRSATRAGLSAMICRLRRKLGSHGRQIVTVRNVGYRFVIDDQPTYRAGLAA
ncbi:MAG: hypothetical protein QOG01_1686 [Pseudonocardiales bacterium]|jgi:DNA-binding response OmpR family regulator|nr:hypothetical protein [Pseudonocardiales bacterium]